MGKHKHSKDRMFITYSEMKHEWCGKKDEKFIPIAKLPFFCCGLSLMPFESPVCTQEGQVFDIVNIIPFIKKYKKNPVTGQPLKLSDLIKLNFYKNDKNPVSFKVFTEHSKIVAIKPSGNVYSYDTIEELNKKPKYYKDLLTGESFTFKDIIIIQDPTNIQQRTVKDFDFIKNNLKITQETQISQDDLINSNQTNNKILEQYQQKKQESDKVQKKIKVENTDDNDSTNYFVKSHLQNKDLLHNSQTINKVSTSVTCSAMEFHRDNELRPFNEQEIRSMFYTEIQKSKQKGYVTIQTNLGQLSLVIHCDLVPITCENFLELCEKKYYNGVKFHRLAHEFCLQGGDPTGTGSGGESIFGKPFITEFHKSLSHDRPGLISMANKGKDTNQSQFFITLSSSPNLDFKHCVFGEIIKGLNLLQFINDQEVDSHDRPKEDIIIKETIVSKNPYRIFIKQFRKKSMQIMKEQNIKVFGEVEQKNILKNIFIEEEEKEKKEQNLVEQLLTDY